MSNITSWRGRREVDRFRGEVDRLFDDFFNRSPFNRNLEKADWSSPIDVPENEKEIIIHAEIAGMEAKEIDISLDGKVLTIRGERKQKKEDKDMCYLRIERRYGTFSRSYELPANVDADKVKAEYKEGVLTLTLPKTKEQTVKKIVVNTIEI